jgi:uroporphyrinogen-III synthase
MRPVAVLRPEPGNAATAARAEAMGLTAIRLPLFAVRPVAWHCPDPAGHDALILTSANAVRHGGPALAGLRGLPVLAVGAATAAAAREAGFEVVETGDRDATALIALADARGVARALYLGGRERMVPPGGPITAAVTVYASDALPIPAEAIRHLSGTVVLLHSARAARRFAALARDRDRYRIATLSPAVRDAAGPGWDAIAVAAAPVDAALLAAARSLAD